MQSNYKTLGDYITPIKVKNADLRAADLLGINIDKFFMPSVANVVGTDLSRYNVVEKNQFACNRMHVGRDYRIPIALSDKDAPFMVSPAYDVFEIKDTSILHPDYLMMWFSRAEFDRNAWFYTDADVRGGLAWDAFCNMKFPLPSPEKQNEIVREYDIIKNRIALNNKLIQKLKETAQAIYIQWFIGFEFPDENGNPYKSSGGKMVWNEELDKEIPENWESKILSELIEVKYGKDYKQLSEGNIPLYGSGGIMGYVNKFLYNKPSVLIPRKGTLNNIMFLNEPFWSVDTMFYSVLKREFYGRYVFYFLSSIDFNSLNVGSAVPSMTTNYLNGMHIIKPQDKTLEKFEELMSKIWHQFDFRNEQNNKLVELQTVLLSKVATIEN